MHKIIALTDFKNFGIALFQDKPLSNKTLKKLYQNITIEMAAAVWGDKSQSISLDPIKFLISYNEKKLIDILTGINNLNSPVKRICVHRGLKYPEANWKLFINDRSLIKYYLDTQKNLHIIGITTDSLLLEALYLLAVLKVPQKKLSFVNDNLKIEPLICSEIDKMCDHLFGATVPDSIIFTPAELFRKNFCTKDKIFDAAQVWSSTQNPFGLLNNAFSLTHNQKKHGIFNIKNAHGYLIYPVAKALLKKYPNLTLKLFATAGTIDQSIAVGDFVVPNGIIKNTDANFAPIILKNSAAMENNLPEGIVKSENSHATVYNILQEHEAFVDNKLKNQHTVEMETYWLTKAINEVQASQQKTLNKILTPDPKIILIISDSNKKGQSLAEGISFPQTSNFKQHAHSKGVIAQILFPN
jgi:hypothetical protein